MGVVKKMISICTCDLCKQECQESDNRIEIQIDNGDGRDVGPGYLVANLRLELPYRVSGGVICRPCSMKWLSRYVKNQGMS